jgi:hypothetical protein
MDIMSKEVFCVVLVLDRINNNLTAYPTVLHTIYVGEYEDTYVVQHSLTNAHLMQVPKKWLFENEAAAQQYIIDNKDKLEEQCIDVLDAYEHHWN